MKALFTQRDSRNMPRRSHLPPARIIAMSFAAAILVGTFLLALPWAHAEGQQVSLLEALFTATSAVCVTGLIVVDTGSAFNHFGQTVIMLLIKLGGLGVVTFGAVFAMVLGERLGYSQRMRAAEALSALQVGGIITLVRRILLLSLGLELLATALLSLHFMPRYGWLRGGFFALFHSISAYNNAGFSLYSDSLESAVANPLIILTLASLFIIGGLGFVVQINILQHMRSPRSIPLLLHSKIVLLSTIFLCVAGFVLITLLEWRNPATLEPLSFGGKLLAGFFQGVTPRTAGFNSIAYGAMHETSILLTILLMFIGGSPGSTAGGVKTVTFFVIFAMTWSLMRGRDDLTLFHRRITVHAAVKAGVVVVLSMVIVTSALIALRMSNGNLPFLAVAFETFSAFATVGLSFGITAELNTPSRLIVMLLMYLGRVGPLTLALALVQSRQRSSLKYPQDVVIIG